MNCLLVGLVIMLTASINAQIDYTIEGPKRFNTSIVVIGGGLSAIHMTYLLQLTGYTDVSVLVKEDRLGGDDFCSRAHRGTVHEMGKHVFVTETETDEIEQTMKEVSAQDSLRRIPLPTVWKTNNKTDLSLETFIQEGGERDYPTLNGDELKDKLLQLIDDLKVVSNNFLPQRGEEVPGEPIWQSKFQLKGSFKTFLTKRGMASLVPLLTFLFSTMGYGRLEDIPAYYCLYFFKPKVLNSLYKRIKDNDGITGITGFKMGSRGMEHFLEDWSRNENMKITKDVRINVISRSNGRYKIDMSVNGVTESRSYDFIVFSDDLKDYIKFNPFRTMAEYQLFLRPRTKYIIKTLVDTYDVPRGDTPFEFYPDSFLSGGTSEYKLVCSIDTFAAQNGHNGNAYKINLLENSNEQRNPNDPNDAQKRKRKSAVYTQMSNRKPTVAEANRVLKQYITDLGGRAEVIDTKIWEFFPFYRDSELTNGMLYSILDLQGKNGMWFIGKSAYFDNILGMIGYNKMLINKIR